VVGRTGITYHQLQTFLAVARSGNLTRVARDLNATQPTVSLQLSSLRRSLGISLFERPGGRFRLTPAGEKLRRYAEETLEGLHILQQDIGVLKGSLTGSLVVGVTFFVVSRVMSGLPRFHVQFPGVDIQAHVDRPEPLFNQLLASTLDVACYLNVQTPPGLTVEPLAQEEFVIIASPQHRLARRRRISSEELSQETLVVSNVSVFRELIETKLRAGGVTPRVVAEARHHDDAQRLVASNVGYSMHLKPLVAAELAAGRFVHLRLDGPVMFGEIVAAFRSRRGAPPLIEEFIRFMRAELERPRDRKLARPTRVGTGSSAAGARRAGHRR
jgi:DNA-binding transcriptional LysR family regulator